MSVPAAHTQCHHQTENVELDRRWIGSLKDKRKRKKTIGQLFFRDRFHWMPSVPGHWNS